MPDSVQDRPLISFCLFAYNQERFIREAVQGAFGQTYSPLEIILSDDCSSDRTFAIMSEMAASYRGPHKIILNQNAKNLGIGGHINRVVELSSGIWIVGAAGDDISMPMRTSKIYEAWIQSDMKAYSIDSTYELINDSGKTLSWSSARNLPQNEQLLYFSKTLINYVHGCTHAWHREVFDQFGALPDITCEDIAIPARSMLLGVVICIDEPLVKYRIHENNIWESTKILTVHQSLDRRIYFLNDFIKNADDVARCIDQFKSRDKDNSYLTNCLSNLSDFKNRLELKKKMLTASTFVRVITLLKYAKEYGIRRADFSFYVCAISKTAFSMGYYLKKFLFRRVTHH